MSKLISAILIILFYSVAFSATDPCESARKEFAEEQKYGAFDFQCDENDGVTGSTWSMSNADRDRMEILKKLDAIEKKVDADDFILTGVNKYSIPTWISCHDWLEQNPLSSSGASTTAPDLASKMTRHISSMDVDDVKKALGLALKYLEPDDATDAVYRTPVDQLRHEANVLEQRELDIYLIKELLKKLEE